MKHRSLKMRAVTKQCKEMKETEGASIKHFGQQNINITDHNPS